MGSGWAPLPTYAIVEANYNCNLKCKTCGIGSKPPLKDLRFKGREPLSNSRLRAILGQLAGLGVIYVSFLGGEPLLRPGILDAIRFCSTKGLYTLMFTNGTTVAPENVRSIVTSGLKHLTFSIDAAGQMHDVIRGVPGTFERAKRGVQLIQQEKQSIGSGYPHISINTTVSSLNADVLEDIADLAAELGVSSVAFQYLSVVDAETLKQTASQLQITEIPDHQFLNSESLLVKGEQLARLRASIERVKTKCRLNSISIDLDPMLDFLFCDEFISTGRFPVGGCQFPWVGTVISPAGDVFPCPMLSIRSMGNLDEEPFSTVWNNDRLREFRVRLRRGPLAICAKCCVAQFRSSSWYYRLGIAKRLLFSGQIGSVVVSRRFGKVGGEISQQSNRCV